MRKRYEEDRKKGKEGIRGRYRKMNGVEVMFFGYLVSMEKEERIWCSNISLCVHLNRKAQILMHLLIQYCARMYTNQKRPNIICQSSKKYALL